MSELRVKSRWKALDIHVLVVASEGYCGDWAAYIGAVDGDSHDFEWQEVLDHGSKLSEKVAEVLFPDFAKEFSWRG